jgi:hypothetical protein
MRNPAHYAQCGREKKNPHGLPMPGNGSAVPRKAAAGGRGHDRREFKEEYWDGNCKVERKLEKSGEYKEERKGTGPAVYSRAPAYPVYVPAPQPVVVEPGIRVQGTVIISQ